MHDSRLTELRDVHRLETTSQSEQIESLKRQLKEVETLFTATTAHSSANETTVKSLREELDRALKQAKDEEEKRVKAVGLLKTVRQKLVKSEKEREDAQKAAQVAKQKETDILEKEQAERNGWETKLENLREKHEQRLLELKEEWRKDVQQAKLTADNDLSLMKERYESESIASQVGALRPCEA